MKVLLSKLVDASLLRMLERDRQRFQLHALLREELRNLVPFEELQSGSCRGLGETVCRLGKALAGMPRVLAGGDPRCAAFMGE